MSENSNQLAAVVGDILERFSATASGNDYTLKTVCGPRTKPSRDNRRTRPDLLEKPERPNDSREHRDDQRPTNGIIRQHRRSVRTGFPELTIKRSNQHAGDHRHRHDFSEGRTNHPRKKISREENHKGYVIPTEFP